jgi:putative polymerase
MADPQTAINAAPARTADIAAGALLIAAMAFNPLLAIINAQITPLGPSPVIACEVLIVACAHLVALLHFRSRMAPWYVLLALLAVFALFRSAAVGILDPKYFRDVLLIPTFIILGMTFRRECLPGLVVAIHLLVVAVLVLEAVSPDAYAELFNIKSYYIQTRGYTEEGFWNADSNLYVSAARPDERFFAFVNFHRMSSIFLEPVSLGNYCIIVVAYVLASWRDLSPAQRVFLLGGTAALLVGCDGRLAAIACLVIAAASLIAPRLPPKISVLLAPFVLVAAIAAVSFLGLKGGADNFSGRLAHTVDLLRQYGPAEFLGISNAFLDRAVDSGLAYLITTQSVFGTALLWLFIMLFTREHSREAIVFKMAAALYLSLSMLVSFSFLSIKTAALLWFILGAMQLRRAGATHATARLGPWPAPAAGVQYQGVG